MSDQPEHPDLPAGQPAPAPGAEPDLMGDLDMSALLEQAQQMQAGIVQAQAEAAAKTVEGVAGGGAVRIEASGGLELRGVHIRPDVVQGLSADDREALEDLLLAAMRDVVARVNQLNAEALGGLGGMFRT